MNAVILGNGPAGVVAAETLRNIDATAKITLIGCESEPPYSRMAIPYLLMGNIDESGTYLRKNIEHFKRLNIELIFAKALSLDDTKQVLQLNNGQRVRYDQLLICTGSHPIKPIVIGIDLPQVHTCWTLADARAIQQKLQKGNRVLQIGAGFIGCIIMESLASRGVKLTVVEMGDRMVPRMMTPAAGNMIRRWVESKGVQVKVNTKVEMLSALPDGSVRATLDNGEHVIFDMVIASAGVKPNMEFLQGSRVALGQGILVNESMQTNVSNIYAAGDVAAAKEFHTGARLVNAIQPNAVEQARIAALNMAGKKVQSQGSLAINVLDTLGLISSSFGQWVGVSQDKGGSAVEQMDHERHRYVSLQFQNNTLIGATAVGLTEQVGALRGLIQGRIRLGDWEQKLHSNPMQFQQAFIAQSQPTAIRGH